MASTVTVGDEVIVLIGSVEDHILGGASEKDAVEVTLQPRLKFRSQCVKEQVTITVEGQGGAGTVNVGGGRR